MMLIDYFVLCIVFNDGFIEIVCMLCNLFFVSGSIVGLVVVAVLATFRVVDW